MASAVDNLTAARDALAAVVAAQTAAWEAAGCPPDFSIDGESYTWSTWLSSKLDAIDRLNQVVLRLRPYSVRSRLRG